MALNFFMLREPEDVSQSSSELAGEHLFDLTTSVAVPVPNTDKGNFALRSSLQSLHTTGNEDTDGR
jgi:hypothetical protein